MMDEFEELDEEFDNPERAANGLISVWAMRRFAQLRPQASLADCEAVSDACFQVLEEICKAKQDDAIERVSTYLDLEERAAK